MNLDGEQKREREEEERTASRREADGQVNKKNPGEQLLRHSVNPHLHPTIARRILPRVELSTKEGQVGATPRGPSIP